MAGYSGTPLARKLGIKPGHTVAILRAPANLAGFLDAFPTDIALLTQLRGAAPKDVLVFFTKSRANLAGSLPRLKEHLAHDGGLWIAWPKRSSGVETDVTEDVVRELALAAGLVDNKVCAIDETWSGLRLVYRLKNRPRPLTPRRRRG